MLCLFIYVYWCPTRFPYQIMFVSFRSTWSLVFWVKFCWSLFVLLYFFFWSLFCLSFGLRLHTFLSAHDHRYYNNFQQVRSWCNGLRARETMYSSPGQVKANWLWNWYLLLLRSRRSTMIMVFVRLHRPYFVFLLTTLYRGNEILYTKRQRCQDVALIDRSKEIRSTAG